MPDYAPPTPPDVRVRIRRFRRLRLTGQPRQSQAVEVRDRQGEVKGSMVGGLPPAASMGGRRRGYDLGTPRARSSRKAVVPRFHCLR